MDKSGLAVFANDFEIKVIVWDQTTLVLDTRKLAFQILNHFLKKWKLAKFRNLKNPVLPFSKMICKSKWLFETRKHHYSTWGSLHLRFRTVLKSSKNQRNFQNWQIRFCRFRKSFVNQSDCLTPENTSIRHEEACI